MRASTPDQAVIGLDEAFAARDLSAVLACYEDQAAVVAQPGRMCRHEALWPFCAHLFTLQGRVRPLETRLLESGDIALFILRGQLSGTGEHGQPLARESIATSVFRRGTGQRWRLLIDNACGPAVLEAADA